MKKSILVLFFTFILFKGYTQVGINRDGSQPDPSAILDAKSTEKGFLPPRMSHAQMNAINTPAEGLMVYCLDCNNDGTGVYLPIS